MWMKRSLACAIATLCVTMAQGHAASTRCRPILEDHSVDSHKRVKGHWRWCGFPHVIDGLTVSKAAGLGRIDVNGNVAAILQRDEGQVAFVDVSDPSRPKVIGRYEDDVSESLDGDVSFSDDGEWLFYARQTSNFDEDGIHVLATTDPTTPTLATYQPGGGTFRLEYYKDDAGEWLVVLDAVNGLVVNQFVPETGALAPVYQDAAPAAKVGGPASAGIYIDPSDPQLKIPLLYVTTGKTGLQVFDFSDPRSPVLLGRWDDIGLAEVEVRSTATTRTVYAATEYWFDKTIPPEVEVLDATDLAAIKKTTAWRLDVPADDLWRVQGMDLAGGKLLVAHSHAGVIGFNRRGKVVAVAADPHPPHEAGGATATPYAFDVVHSGRTFFFTDAATGRLTVGLLRRPPRFP